MTTLLVLFLVAFGFSLALTPLAGRLGARLGAVDVPAERKIHLKPIPRIGGVAVFLSFSAAMALTNLYNTQVSELFVFDQRTALGFCGALVVFGCGLWDDFERLNPWIKLLFQIFAASLAFGGGISIGGCFLGAGVLKLGALSYGATVLWFLLFINAVNLIDGLDGLAGGVVFFTCALMVILSVMRGEYLFALHFAALGGAVLGFLRYNFNPASIFLGDGGSYFLGYAVAALSIMGSVKSQVGALMLLPLLALGVPVFDTISSPVRRWVLGRKIFQPDRGHIHHKLLAMGITSRKAVLILYGVTAALCALAILLVNLRSEEVGLFLVILGVGALILMRKIGYLEYFAIDKVYGWFRDMTDVSGLSHDRRSFLGVQIEMNHARDLDELWYATGMALDMLKFDRGHLYIGRKKSYEDMWHTGASWDGVERRRDQTANAAGPDAGGMPAAGGPAGVFSEVRRQEGDILCLWSRGPYRRRDDLEGEGLLKIDLPVANGHDGKPEGKKNGSRRGRSMHAAALPSGADLGRHPSEGRTAAPSSQGAAGNTHCAMFFLAKDLNKELLQPYTLRRVEHLRRTLNINIPRILKKEVGGSGL